MPALTRSLGRWDLAALTINSTVGAGILGLPGKMYALVGVYSVVACLVGGVLMGLVAGCYAEAASRVEGTGGTILYARAAFGPGWGFVAGWLGIVTRLLSFASITNLAVGYAAAVVPALAGAGGRVVAISCVACGLGAVVALGVGVSARTNGAFTVAKLGLLGGFVVVGVVYLLGGHGVAGPASGGVLPPAGHWGPAVVLMLFGLIGMDSTVINGGEMREPRRDVPFGLAAGMLAVVGLYAAILLVCAGVVPDLAASQRPVFDGMVAMLGVGAGRVVAGCAVLIMLGTLFVILFTGPRLVLALAEAGQLPAALGRIDARFRTPLVAVAVHTGAAWALAVGSTFLGALTASTLTRLMLYGLTAAAVVVMRRRGIAGAGRPLVLPGGMAMAVAGLGGCVWLMGQLARAAWVSAGWLGILGVSVFWLARQPSASQP